MKLFYFQNEDKDLKQGVNYIRSVSERNSGQNK